MTPHFFSWPQYFSGMGRSRIKQRSKKISLREELVVNAANNLLSFAIGKLYVEKYFSQSDKVEIVSNICQSLRKDL